MEVIILYIIFSYLYAFGIIVEESLKDKNNNHWYLLLAPLLVPIFLGMDMVEKNK